MSYGPIKVFSTTIASGASTSSYIDLGKSNTQFAINAVTAATGAALAVYGCPTATGTYYPIYMRIASATAQYNQLVISTAMSGSWAVIDPIPFQFIEFVASAVINGGQVITVLAQD